MASPSWSRRRHLRHRACSHCTCIIPAHVWHVSVLLAYIVPPAQRCKQFCESDCNRGLARGDRNQKPLNDRQRTHFRGVRVALGTGYSHGERGRRAWRNAPTRRCPCAGHCPTLLLLLLRRRRRRLLRRRAQRWRAQDDGAWPPPHPGDTAGRERRVCQRREQSTRGAVTDQPGGLRVACTAGLECSVSRRKYHAAKGGEGERTG
jgi:hypothetical protein